MNGLCDSLTITLTVFCPCLSELSRKSASVFTFRRARSSRRPGRTTGKTMAVSPADPTHRERERKVLCFWLVLLWQNLNIVTVSCTCPLTPGLSPVESAHKSPAVVRPKDSAASLIWRETGSAMEESKMSFQEELALNDQAVYSYQQISCLDSVIRYKHWHECEERWPWSLYA